MKYRDLPELQKNLVDTLLTLEKRDEVAQFLRDLMTDSELNELAARWKAAQMLHCQESYTEIIAATGLSSTTVARVSKWLKQGTGGYRVALRRNVESEAR